MRFFVLLAAVSSGCSLIPRSINEPCVKEVCFSGEMVLSLEEGVPSVSFPDATAEERVPNVVMWTNTFLLVPELLCDEGFSGEGFAAGLFEAEDFPVAYGEQGDTTAFERAVGAPPAADFPPLELGVMYEVMGTVQNRYDSGTVAGDNWIRYFVLEDGSSWQSSYAELCPAD